MNDKGYEKLIKAMKHLNSDKRNIYLATMKSENSCKLNNITLDHDDLLIAEHLTTGYIRKEGFEYVEISKLNPGDMVLVLKLNDEKYVIVERLMEV